ncbi:light-harvesting protein [Thetidibacter halocola]|uniref:Antenna pigment protein alpha chain n=1 Tax=Thetidibacter halocola TaxID=2827239 RepID=A0A8J7W826_9RHOB|nr:light-harvesting protein [Thetidibacter halocola]MBS0122632.1 light-harvesting protein [Thetidibacter halocola]
MNNAKMWLVVSPSVGVPIFLGAVAVGSFAVHVAVLSKVSWYNDYLSGQPLGAGDTQEAAARMLPDTDSAKAAYTMPMPDGGQQVLVVMPDGTTATAVLQPPGALLASASAPAGKLVQN